MDKLFKFIVDFNYKIFGFYWKRTAFYLSFLPKKTRFWGYYIADYDCAEIRLFSFWFFALYRDQLLWYLEKKEKLKKLENSN